MGVESKARVGQDSFVEALRSEMVAGTEILSDWINHIQAQKGIEVLFEFETWLRGLCAFFDCKNLPLSNAERTAVITRNFAAEIRVGRLALQECEHWAVELCALGQDAKVEFEALVESQIYKARIVDSQVGKMLEQSTPVDSLVRLLESINDLKVTIDALQTRANLDFQLFLSIGRTLQRDLRNCRYVDMLLGQRFRLQYDRIDNAILSGILRSIFEDHLRRNVALALLYLYRFLRYLKPISNALGEDRPLRGLLAIFSLLHEQTEYLCDFIKTRFLKERRGNSAIRNAAELMVHSLRLDLQRVFDRELRAVSTERDASAMFGRIENSYGLLSNCYQGCVVTLVQAFDKQVDGKALFPSMMEGLQNSQKLQRDLWALRQDLKDDLDDRGNFDMDRILSRIAQFQESSMQYLMFRDWGEFERFSESLISAGNQFEARTLLLRFLGFLEVLAQEVANRSVLHNPRNDPEHARTP